MLWKVLHFLLSKCDFSRLFHTERSWHTYRFTVVFVSGRQDLPPDERAFSLTLFFFIIIGCRVGSVLSCFFKSKFSCSLLWRERYSRPFHRALTLSINTRVVDRAAIEPNRTESQVRSRKLEFGSWKSEVGSWKSEVGNQKLEVRSRKWEVGSGKSEVESQKWEVESGKWEVGSGRSEGLAIQL